MNCSTGVLQGRSLLGVFAHPDDESLACGGLLAWCAELGARVSILCATRGEMGRGSVSDLSLIRTNELAAAARALGVSDVRMLDYEDGMLEATIALRRDLTRLIRRFRPDAVVCGDPTVRYYGSTYLNHPDHRAAADAALDATFPSAGTRLIFPELLAEGLEPHEVRQVYIHGAERPDTYVDIAGTLDVKLADRGW